MLRDLYRPSLSLLTDLYQLTMACAHWKNGTGTQEAVFHLSFRTAPFGGGYAIAAGLQRVVDFVSGFRFDQAALDYLATVPAGDGSRLFPDAFLADLGTLRLACDLDAVPEGTAVFAHEPLVRVRGPLVPCQLLETPLLNLLGFPTLVATKAARICQAAGEAPVLEFGLRRAQGIDGALTASRAAYIGGCAATSNVLAGQVYGIPVRGTHAHSWVMAFPSELEAFAAYAEALPNNCVLLVDTYDTLAGVRNAIRIGRQLRAAGHRLAGIRLDSGDLAYLSVEARRLLDAAGFDDTLIMASNDLDEQIIASVRGQGGCITAWGVGTRLATASDDPALGCIYKMGALRRAGGDWEYKLKLSDQTVKTSIPGVLQVRRFRDADRLVGDAVYDLAHPVPETWEIVDPADANRHRMLAGELAWQDLLVPVIRDGEAACEAEGLEAIRARAASQLAGLHPTIRRVVNPHGYPVGLERGLHTRRTELIRTTRAAAGATSADRGA